MVTVIVDLASDVGEKFSDYILISSEPHPEILQRSDNELAVYIPGKMAGDVTASAFTARCNDS